MVVAVGQAGLGGAGHHPVRRHVPKLFHLFLDPAPDGVGRHRAAQHALGPRQARPRRRRPACRCFPGTRRHAPARRRRAVGASNKRPFQARVADVDCQEGHGDGPGCLGVGPAVTVKPAHDQASRPWQCLYFLPLPQGQGSLRPTRGTGAAACRAVLSSSLVSTSPVSVGRGIGDVGDALGAALHVLGRLLELLAGLHASRSSGSWSPRSSPNRAAGRTARTPRACTPAWAAFARSRAGGCPGAGNRARTGARAIGCRCFAAARPARTG